MKKKDTISIFLVSWPVFSAMVVLDTYVQEGLLAHESDVCNAVSAKSVKSFSWHLDLLYLEQNSY